MKARIVLKSFPNHKGIPGHQGGSLPEGGSHETPRDVYNRTHPNGNDAGFKAWLPKQGGKTVPYGSSWKPSPKVPFDQFKDDEDYQNTANYTKADRETTWNTINRLNIADTMQEFTDPSGYSGEEAANGDSEIIAKLLKSEALFEKKTGRKWDAEKDAGIIRKRLMRIMGASESDSDSGW
jgi:hypothetical protein